MSTLERDMGIEVTLIKGNDYGEVDPDDIRRDKKQFGPDRLHIILKCERIIMPVGEIGRTAHEYGIRSLWTSQGAGALPVDVESWYIDMLAFPGHKGLMGPQGTGAFRKEGIRLRTLMEGGQEVIPV